MTENHYETYYPSRFLRGADIPRPMVIKITGFVGEDLQGENGTETKAILRYMSADGPGEIVWNKTNAKLTEAVLGTADVTEWRDQYITIHFDESVMFGGVRKGGIRVFGGPRLRGHFKVELKRPRRRRPDVYHLKRTDQHGNVTNGNPQPEPARAANPGGFGAVDDEGRAVSPGSAPTDAQGELIE